MKRRLTKALMTAGVAVTVGFPIAAGAQTANYPGQTPPQVLGESVIRGAPPAAPAVSSSQRGDSLPVTGGDIAGLAALGLGVIATGSVLVRRSRVRPT